MKLTRNYLLTSLVFLLACLSVVWVFLFLTVTRAQSATTTESVTLNAGALSVTASTTLAFTAVTVSSTNQTTTATSTAIAPVDTRGSGAGYSVTNTTTNLTFNGSTSTMAGSNNTVNFIGAYTGTPSSTGSQGQGVYTIEITTGGTVGTAVFKWTNAASSTTTGVTTSSTVSLDGGISSTFASATYVVGDKWRLNVSSQPYIGLTETPTNLVGVNGSLIGEVTLGASGAFTGAATSTTSNARTLLTSAFGFGLGSYTFDIGFSLTVLKNSLSGAHTGTLTITVA